MDIVTCRRLASVISSSTALRLSAFRSVHLMFGVTLSSGLEGFAARKSVERSGSEHVRRSFTFTASNFPVFRFCITDFWTTDLPGWKIFISVIPSAELPESLALDMLSSKNRNGKNNVGPTSNQLQQIAVEDKTIKK